MKNSIAILLVFLFVGCQGQEKEKEAPKEEEKETTATPKGQWEVRREYDEQGNLIRYDSLYSYAYPDLKGDSVRVNLDSIMDLFRNFFQAHPPFDWNDRFSYFPERDSLFMKDFFREDYFMDRWERQSMDIDEMLRQMDSVRNAFMKRFHPGLMESKPEN